MIRSNNLKMTQIFSASDVKHGVSLFTNAEISAVDEMIIEQDGRYSIRCQKKERYKVAKPEEIVRQLWIYRLLNEYCFPEPRIEVERVVYFGSRDSGLADIVVLHDDMEHPYIVFEVKRPKRTAGLEQLKSYCNAEGAPIGVWSNGNEMIRLHREEPNIFVEIPRIPRVTESLRDILKERWTIEWLEQHDELKQGKTTLKKILFDLEELVLGNSGVDSFNEIFKLIYAKLFDEWNGINDSSYQLDFFVGDRSPQQIMKSIGYLLDGAKRNWSGIFEPTERIELRDTHLKVCVSFLEKIKLFNSNLRIIDEAFEYLIPQVSKKKDGQFFTPRPIEDMAVEMLNPKADEFVIDPACGSAGFLLHSIMWIAGGAISGKPLTQRAQNFAQNNVFGIDLANLPVKIAKAINLIVGDGKSNIYKDNSLVFYSWSDETKVGLRSKLRRFLDDLDKDEMNQNLYKYFDFDVLLTNPPFAGTVKERDTLRHYKLAEKNGKLVEKIGRHIPFVERSLHFLRPGGRMAIVLPQGLMNNTSAEYIRRFIFDEARILAVVGLHVNTFKPHTGTKTSVLFLQKYKDDQKITIQEYKARHEGEWDDFIRDLNKKYQNVDYDTLLNETDMPDELKSFIEVYFETAEEIEEEFKEGINEVGEKEDEIEQSNKNKMTPLPVLVEDYLGLIETKSNCDDELEQLICQDERLKQQKKQLGRKKEMLEERTSLDELIKELYKQARPMKKDIKTLDTKISNLYREILERTIGGRIKLALSAEKITEQFKKFWLNGKIALDIDYPIYFAVNQKAVKDNTGEYRYARGANGELLIDKNGHVLIDHDLDNIAKGFVQFAKQQDLDFWRS